MEGPNKAADPSRTDCAQPRFEPDSEPAPTDFADALPTGPARGRGSGLNPSNRFQDLRLHVLGEHLDEVTKESPEGARLPTTVLPDRSRTVINRVDSPDLPMDWTINPYRGCEHGCIYCYARPGHEYLSMSCGVDFETKILAKHDAPELLRKELAHPRWRGEAIAMSGVTDPYQPIERELRITRGCLEVMAECRQAVTIITKNHLVTRDLDLLKDLHRDRACAVAVSITTLDARLASKMEPRASAPRDRLRAVEEIASAGIPVMVMTAPIIPAINDREIPALLKAAKEAGASGAGFIMLRLPHQVKALFLEWLQRHFPDRAAHVESLIRDVREGGLSDPRFGSRMRGRGPMAEQIARAHRLFCRRYGLNGARGGVNTTAFRRPRGADGQMGLW